MSKFTTNHQSCRLLADLLVEYGVENVVLSPGSRNAPLVVAVARKDELRKFVIVDERSAAFAAVGMALQTSKPVAIVCTSGSAVLNYAPAVAEAKYRNLPLIVVSADRQAEWIDQNDSQTIQQYQILENVVLRSVDIPAYYDHDDTKWWIGNQINDALQCATAGVKGPVHINIRLKEPLNGVCPCTPSRRAVKALPLTKSLAESDLQSLAKIFMESRRVMILATQTQPSPRLAQMMRHFASMPQVTVLSESISNIGGGNVISCIDRTITAHDGDLTADFAPDLLITFGGAPVSRMIKRFLRAHSRQHEWRIGEDSNLIDTMQHVTCLISMNCEQFFEQFLKLVSPQNFSESYAEKWQDLNRKGRESHDVYAGSGEWTAMRAFDVIFPSIPNDYNLHLSNGTSIRYAQLFDNYHPLRCDCNRGVSGIDGSTSTALGASLVSENPTLLITGDMSFSYDLNGIASQYNHKNFKIIVMCNGGGGIFRFIPSTSALPELEQYFEVQRDFPAVDVARALGYTCFEASNEAQLKAQLPQFYECHQPALLAVRTDGEADAALLKRYMRRNCTANND